VEFALLLALVSAIVVVGLVMIAPKVSVIFQWVSPWQGTEHDLHRCSPGRADRYPPATTEHCNNGCGNNGQGNHGTGNCHWRYVIGLLVDAIGPQG
jgi:hypothetical protein